MDPQTTLIELLELLEVGDKHAAAEAARNLADWLEKDEFCPIVDGTNAETVTEVGIRKSWVWVVPTTS